MNVDAHECRNCGATLTARRRRGSLRAYCSARCRKAAWLKTLSVPSVVGHVAHKPERLGRLTDRVGKAVDLSGRTIRRMHELMGLVAELFGPEKVIELREEMRAGRTAPIYSMLKAAKSMAKGE